MNWQVILAMIGLIKGSNVFQTVGNVLHTAGTTVAAIDSNDAGNDDLAAQLDVVTDGWFSEHLPNTPGSHQ